MELFLRAAMKSGLLWDWLMNFFGIPDICQFWGTTTLLRPVKRAPKIAQSRDRIAETGQNLAFYFYILKGACAWKNAPMPVVAVVTNISYVLWDWLITEKQRGDETAEIGQWTSWTDNAGHKDAEQNRNRDNTHLEYLWTIMVGSNFAELFWQLMLIAVLRCLGEVSLHYTVHCIEEMWT